MSKRTEDISEVMRFLVNITPETVVLVYGLSEPNAYSAGKYHTARENPALWYLDLDNTNRERLVHLACGAEPELLENHIRRHDRRFEDLEAQIGQLDNQVSTLGSDLYKARLVADEADRIARNTRDDIERIS